MGAGLFQVVLTDFVISKVIALGTSWTFLLIAHVTKKPHKVRVRVKVWSGFEVRVAVGTGIGAGLVLGYAGVDPEIRHGSDNSSAPTLKFNPDSYPKPAAGPTAILIRLLTPTINLNPTQKSEFDVATKTVSLLYFHALTLAALPWVPLSTLFVVCFFILRYHTLTLTTTPTVI